MEMAEGEPFEPPPEAPILTPNASEFADPIAYIASTVRPVIERTGICKIRPPEVRGYSALCTYSIICRQHVCGDRYLGRKGLN